MKMAPLNRLSLNKNFRIGSKKEATHFEHERDAKSEEADHLIHRHHAFARAVTLFQVAIALGAVAALTRMSRVWLLSIATGFVGLVMFLLPFI